MYNSKLNVYFNVVRKGRRLFGFPMLQIFIGAANSIVFSISYFWFSIVLMHFFKGGKLKALLKGFFYFMVCLITVLYTHSQGLALALIIN